ncbi:hypothetical protein [Halodesulfovibrio aestuarii]|uniref:Uncharacterized protein n=1 Tax=Halodesulfovibrio aestuarii TaxID=126333 RepID=A0ABV4JT55_9BACT
MGRNSALCVVLVLIAAVVIDAGVFSGVSACLEPFKQFAGSLSKDRPVPQQVVVKVERFDKRVVPLQEVLSDSKEDLWGARN